MKFSLLVLALITNAFAQEGRYNQQGQDLIFGQDKAPPAENYNAGGYPGLGGMYGGFPTSGMGMSGYVAPANFSVEKNPKLEVKIDKKKSLSCDLDSQSKMYLCDDGVILKASGFGFLALGRDEKDKTPKILTVTDIEAEGKVISSVPEMAGGIYGGLGMGISPDAIKPNVSMDYINKVAMIDGFFKDPANIYNDPKSRIKGSPAFEKIAGEYLSETQKLKEEYDALFRQSKYEVELEDGTKVSCNRDTIRTFTKEETEMFAKMNQNIQCGSFKCDPVKVDGKDYQVQMFYESNPLMMSGPTVHIYNKDGFGPRKEVRKISSDKSSTPLVDNSLMLSMKGKYPNPYTSYYQSSLPQSLSKEEKQNIAFYKSPNMTQTLDYYQNICKDEAKTLNEIRDSRKKVVAKIADMEMAEFIQIVGNGNLVGQYVDPTKAAQMGCMYEGVFLDPEAARNLSRIKKDIHPDKHVDQTISLDRATELFNKAAAMKDIAWKFKPDGCYARAHLMARRFEAEGVRVDKVWIKGDLYVPGTEPLIQWNFHVAPIVYVEDAKGKVQKMVIDPSLFDKPVTVEEWDNKMAKNTAKGSVVTTFPFPENSAAMERSTLSFSSSDPYLPRDSIYMSEDEKMQQANETMRMYKQMEPK